jgi:predicted unusual protein kinase regulating ubiquinone biosynthesis (AarF/ABC1/UbiB family)
MKVLRKLKIWDFSSRFAIRKRVLDTFYINTPNYSSKMKDFGVWTKNYITDLGPTFIKLGQILSSRNDLFPKEFIEEIVMLQDNVTQIPEDDVKNVLGDNILSLFSYFDYTPYKAASLGQVHKAILTSGVRVAVKIQRPYIKEIIEDDFRTIENIIDILESLGISTGGESSKYVFQDTRQNLLNELDYKREAQNALRFRKYAKDIPWIVIPRVFISKSTDKILIMEWVYGIKITDTDSLKKNNIELVNVSKLLVESFILQTMDFGFFHGDPHPGNVAVSKTGKLIFYDFGLVVDVPPGIKNNSREILLCLLQKNSRKLVDLFIEIGLIIPNTKNKYEISLFFDFILNYLEKVQNNVLIRDTILDKLSMEKPFIVPYSFIFLTKIFKIYILNIAKLT